jgi:hypothetical protein
MLKPALVLVFGLLALSCGGRSGDATKEQPVNPLGKGLRIREVTDPEKNVAHNTNVNVSGAVVVAVDTYDETGDGKSRGGIFIQDVDSKEPFSGIGLFSPTFIPAELRIAPGDVLDFNGPFQQNASIGTAKFPGPPDAKVQNVLIQLSRPVGTFRFDGKVPEPTVIDVKDLTDYAVGRKWYGMLVTVKNVTVQSASFDRSNRLQACIANCGDSKTNVFFDNELTPIEARDVDGVTYKSVTGVVTYFFTLKIAPRTAADLVE